jgi:Protein of unknown function (DUF2911)
MVKPRDQVRQRTCPRNLWKTNLFIGELIMPTNVKAEAPKLEFPAASPTCTFKQRVGLTDIEITYSRPALKERHIFGDLVAYGKVWRTGANAATKLVFSTPVKLNGHDLAAGTYALMTIPEKDKWTIIINKGNEQWGAYSYDEKADVLRFDAKSITLEKPVETFTIDFDNVRDESADLTLTWEKTKVAIKLELEYAAKLVKDIEEVMSSDAPGKPYFWAAQYFYNHNKDMKLADKWIDEAIKERDAFFTVHLKAKILERLGDKAGALATAKRSLEMSEKANDAAYIKLNEALIARLK